MNKMIAVIGVITVAPATIMMTIVIGDSLSGIREPVHHRQIKRKEDSRTRTSVTRELISFRTFKPAKVRTRKDSTQAMWVR